MKLDESWQRYYSGEYPDLVCRYDWMVRRVKPPSVLDIGCGQCLLGHLLHQKRPEVTKIIGLDNNPAILADGKKRLKAEPIVLKQGPAEILPYRDGGFSTVVLCEILEHIPSVAPVIQEALRVLEFDGRLIASVPVELTRSKAHRRLFRSTDDLKVLFGDRISWRGGQRLHRWYFVWGDKRG